MPVRKSNSCVGKTRYETEDEAERSRDHRARTSGAFLEVYWCRYCQGFHLGHPQKLNHGRRQ